MLVVKRFVLDIGTYYETLFCGHFGLMGLGALFLAMKARAQPETGTSRPLPDPEPIHKEAYNHKDRVFELVGLAVGTIVLGSTMIYGLWFESCSN